MKLCERSVNEDAPDILPPGAITKGSFVSLMEKQLTVVAIVKATSWRSQSVLFDEAPSHPRRFPRVHIGAPDRHSHGAILGMEGPGCAFAGGRGGLDFSSHDGGLLAATGPDSLPSEEVSSARTSPLGDCR